MKYKQFDVNYVLDSDEYSEHVNAMIIENLRSKRSVALELAARDLRIKQLERANIHLEKEVHLLKELDKE